jgi:hypothetical protein
LFVLFSKKTTLKKNILEFSGFFEGGAMNKEKAVEKLESWTMKELKATSRLFGLVGGASKVRIYQFIFIHFLGFSFRNFLFQ